MENLYSDLVNFVSHPLPYQERVVSIIDKGGKESLASSFVNPFDKTLTIKIQSIEKFSKQMFDFSEKVKSLRNHSGPITCHAFLSHASSKSFGKHFDYDDVYLICIQGEKEYWVNGEYIILKKGDCLFIEAGTEHYASQTIQDDTLVLSFGLEKYLNEKLY